MIVPLIALTLLFLTACGNNQDKDLIVDEPTATVSPIVDDSSTTQPVSEPETVTKELAPYELLAMDYINILINGSDSEAKKKFVEEKVRDDVKSVFELMASLGVEEENMLKKPMVIGSSKYQSDGLKGTITLIRSEDNKETIVLILEDKIAWGFNSDTTDEAILKTFNDMKSKIV